MSTHGLVNSRQWAEGEVRIGDLPGHSPRTIIYERKKGVLTGRFALARISEDS